MPKDINTKIILGALKHKISTPEKLDQLKRGAVAHFKLPLPTNSNLLKTYRELIKKKKIKSNKPLELLLQKRKVRTLSGVAVIAVLTKPYPCPGNCSYCPTEKNMPKSYLSNEPAVMRAILSGFDPFRQVRLRLQALENNGHLTDKIELIIMGGTWSSLPRRYQNWFIKRCFDGLNNKNSRDLVEAQKRNEKAKNRLVGLTLETRPDYINLEEIKRMRKFGCTRIELGVQSLDDYILLKNKRGHKSKEIVEATKLLKKAGFKIMYHIMPNLPGSTLTKDLKIFKKLFSDSRFKPDMLKIYPCVVTKGSTIHGWWKKGKYQPYNPKSLLNLLIKIKILIPSYVRLARLIRDIPAESIEAGNKVSNLREIAKREMKKRNLSCQCIRCREARNEKVDLTQIKLFIKKYEASEGLEYFLSYESRNRKTLYAFLRLRLPHSKRRSNFRHLKSDLLIHDTLPELKNAALIREVHTYGQLVPLNRGLTSGTRGQTSIPNTSTQVQHIGLGKRLMTEAEKIATKNGYKKIAVISGVGVREYYRKLGFRRKGTYMVKYY